MDKVLYFVCQTDELLAKGIKIAEVDSAFIFQAG
jgi:hypothetical protein